MRTVEWELVKTGLAQIPRPFLMRLHARMVNGFKPVIDGQFVVDGVC